MKESVSRKKRRLELSNGIDLRNMINERNIIRGQVVNTDGGAKVVGDMIHTLNRRDRRRAIHLDKIKLRDERKV